VGAEGGGSEGGFYDEEMRCNGATWKEGNNAVARGRKE
jgi:hypothetical protein